MATTLQVDLRAIAQSLGLSFENTSTVVDLLDAGNTVPFITRYRKDQTGGFDEEMIRKIQSSVQKARMLLERKQTILRSIESQSKLTPELSASIEAATTTRQLEDLYLPYKPRKQSLATTARERGLEPLADEIYAGSSSCANLESRAADFINPDKQVRSIADALLGAGHILAERISERADLRGRLRAIYESGGRLVTSAAEPEVAKSKGAAAEVQPQLQSDASPAQEEQHSGEQHAEERHSGEIDQTGGSAEEPSAELTPEQGAAEDAQDLHSASGSAEQEAELELSGASEESGIEQDEASREAEDSQHAADLSETIVLEAPESSTGSDDSATETPRAAESAETTDPAATTDAPPAAGTAPAFAKKSAKEKRKAQAMSAKALAAARQEKKKEDERKSFRDYFNYSEAINKVPPHRILAINRGERAKAIKVRFEVDLAAMLQVIDEMIVPPDHLHADFVRGCAQDAMHRLILPSLEREVRRELTERAEAHAVLVFERNLRKLMLQPPVRDRRVLAVDPGFRSGCKLVALDEFSQLLDHSLIHVVGNAEKRAASKSKVAEMVRQHNLSVIVIGNGTACRACEDFVSEILADELKDSGVSYVIVNEAGASVYSTSRLGREEFPQFDATVRGAISIGRRLQDPLSELVKIDAANIGVGMYQHDMNARHLRDTLDGVVASCVNFVGVDLNTASPALLRYVSGLNQLTAQRIFDYRLANGPFRTREQLMNVTGVGESTYIQAAGFLKISGGENPLDATWIHPESYAVATSVLNKLGMSPADLAPRDSTAPLASRMEQVDTQQLTQELGVGELTFRDIVSQLSRPGRDPRESLPPPIFKRGVLQLVDLQPGMELNGTVLNVVDFGAFVDIGLKGSGLVHVSQLVNRFVADPHEVVSVGDIVRVWVMGVDKERRRVSLTMIEPGTRTPHPPARNRGASSNRPARATVPPQGETSVTTHAEHAAAAPRPHGRPPQRSGKGGRQKSRTVVKAKTFVKAAPKPLIPLTEGMVKGKAPLRTFGDLKQFWEMHHTEDSPPEGEGG